MRLREAYKGDYKGMKKVNYNFFDGYDEDEGIIRTWKDFSVDSVEELKEELIDLENIYAIRLYDDENEMIEDFDTEYGCDFTNFDWNEIEELMDEVSYIEVCWEFEEA